MIPDTVTIHSTDEPPAFAPFTLRRPRPDEWNDYQDELASGLHEEAALNLTLACAGDADRARINEVADDQPALIGNIMGELLMMAGGFADGAFATRLDAKALVEVADRMPIEKPTEADTAAFAIIALCDAAGLHLPDLRKLAAYRPGRSAVFLVDDVGVFAWRRPGYAAFAAFQRMRRKGHTAQALNQLAVNCVLFPSAGDTVAIFERYPALATSGAAIVATELAKGFEGEAKKGSPASGSAPMIQSPLASA